MSEARNTMGRRPSVYLASASAQRRTTLEELGIAFQLLKVDVEEIVAATARETVEENARRKLVAGLTIAEKGAVVIAADTVLETQGRLLGKPADEIAATEYLQKFSGGSALACSAVAVAVTGAAQGRLATETAEVHFKVLSPEIIRWYLSTREPMGRAGAFGIGHLGEILTESIDGGYSCVSGLPKTALIAALASVAGEQMPESLRHMPAMLMGTRVQLRSLAIHPS
jgi:septum formation protein